MNTFILDPQTSNLTVQDLLNQLAGGDVAVLDEEGNVIAYVVSPAEREALIYAEAMLDLQQHQAEIAEALKRKGGITTKQLLQKAMAAAGSQQNMS